LNQHGSACAQKKIEKERRNGDDRTNERKKKPNGISIDGTAMIIVVLCGQPFETGFLKENSEIRCV